MNLLLREERRGRFRMELAEGLDPEEILRALDAPGERLKRSAKSETRRAGPWVVKQSLRAFRSKRCRQAWRAGIYLTRRGVAVPRPAAYVEERRCGIALRSALLVEHLDGFVNVEEHARAMKRRSEDAAEVHRFLNALAQAVGSIEAAEAWHADLSGKNIFTVAGERLTFIDLDDVVVGRSCTRAERLKNHIQLYDSFCDVWGPEFLDPFIAAMLPQDEPEAAWIEAVRAGQRARRARIKAIWEKQSRE